MTKVTTIQHEKGKKHKGKTNWTKVIAQKSPKVDDENPELAANPKNKYYKPGRKNS